MKYTRNYRELKEKKTPCRVAGLTGGIAGGKSTASAALKNAGYVVIDADEISRELFKAGTANERELAALFPAAKTKDGGLDRRKLRDIISHDKKEKSRLEAYTHPKIIERIKSLIASSLPPIVLSAPLLFESSLAALCDYTVNVYAPKPTRVKRLIARDNATKAQAEQIIDAQIPDEYRATLADFCVPDYDRTDREFAEEIVELFDAIFAIGK